MTEQRMHDLIQGSDRLSMKAAVVAAAVLLALYHENNGTVAALFEHSAPIIWC